MVQSEAFDVGLERFLAGGDDGRLDLLAAYSRRRLRELVTGAFDRLRSAGRDVALAPHSKPDVDAAVAAALGGGRRRGRDRAGAGAGRPSCAAARRSRHCAT